MHRNGNTMITFSEHLQSARHCFWPFTHTLHKISGLSTAPRSVFPQSTHFTYVETEAQGGNFRRLEASEWVCWHSGSSCPASKPPLDTTFGRGWGASLFGGSQC